jgi:hypothetical protein
MAALLTGLQKPESGLLLPNGLDRSTLGDRWHELATEAPQFHENQVLNGALGFNLLVGRNWPASDDALQEATDLCKGLGLGELLERMPSGMIQQRLDQGTIVVNKYTAKITRCTVPCITVVRPVPSDSVATMMDSSSSTVDLTSIPSDKVQPVASETMATAGMVRPMLASADPSARLRLVCKRLARAAW